MKTASSFLLAALLLGVTGQSAEACGYDEQVNNPFQMAYPGSLVLALNTHVALKNRQISPLKSLNGQAGMTRSERWLTDLRGRLEQQGFNGSVSLLLVDSGLWSRISESEPDPVQAGVTELNSRKKLSLVIHSEEPAEGEGVILTTEAALAALLSGEIRLDQAVKMGLVRAHNEINLSLFNAALHM